MHSPLFNIIKPYLAACIALILTITLIIYTYFFVEFASVSHWSTAIWLLLTCILLIIISQIKQTEKNIKNYSDQLLISKERLTNEIKHRLWAEKTASESKIRSLFVDENIPVMLAYFNRDLRCRYHNRIFRRWFGLKPDQIDGLLLKEFSNEEFSSAIQDCIEEILAGKTIHNERILKSIKGFPYIFTEQYLPHLDSTGKTIGFYTLHTPRAQEKNHVSLKNKNQHIANLPKTLKNKPQEISKQNYTNQNTQLSLSKSEITSTRIAQAIEEGEFDIYYQEIISIKPSDSSTSHYEILIRMHEEENSLMPPGSFLPLVDQFKMMSKLDHWIINHIIQWLSVHSTPSHSIFYLNMAKDTLSDPTSPDFIHDQLQKMGIAASNICFEIEVSDAKITADILPFVQKVRELGCLISLCSFDGAPESLSLLDKMEVDYIKIDGSLICNILYDDEDLNKVKIINQLAHDVNVKTIAELVETDDIIKKLREIGIDYAQGFGIAKPYPFKDLQLES
jgi:EAL domain-containing protein (putative c-di-GMP-specific phosphodiesterase class I)/PAS domain-containing protein